MMLQYIGSNRKVRIVQRKVFENFYCCPDHRAYEAACEKQPDDSWEICVYKKYDDPDMEHLRQWLLANGAEESDKYVFVVNR
jgi:hypothetical protein